MVSDGFRCALPILQGSDPFVARMSGARYAGPSRVPGTAPGYRSAPSGLQGYLLDHRPGEGRHRRLRPLCDKFFVQPATAVVAPPNLSAHQPAGNAASRHDDPPQMPGGWFGRAPLQSKLADVDGCDRCHADPLWLKLPAAGTARSGHLGAPSSSFTIVAPAATARNHTDATNPVLDPRDRGIIANRSATVVNEVRAFT
jgi:hypothetical protein